EREQRLRRRQPHLITRASAKKSAIFAVGALEYQRHAAKGLAQLRRRWVAGFCALQSGERMQSDTRQWYGCCLSAQESQRRRRQRADSLLCSSRLIAAASVNAGSPQAISFFHNPL